MTKVGPSKTSSTAVEPGSVDSVGSEVPAAFRAKRPSSNRKSSILSLAVMALIVPGIFATVALPAYAFSTAPDTSGVEASQALQEITQRDAQTVVVAAKAEVATVSRDGFTTTSAAEMARAALAVEYSAYTGPSAADFLANPPYPNFSLDQVVSVALQYTGVPYRYGGADPSGFDCSGYVMFVYAQFGIALPHSAAGIGASGTPIATSDALPGDIVIMPGHTGIYMGDGNFIDSGDYGDLIHVRPIYDSNYYIVRVGI